MRPGWSMPPSAGVGDEVEALLAAVVGMRAPADVGDAGRRHGAAGAPRASPSGRAARTAHRSTCTARRRARPSATAGRHTRRRSDSSGSLRRSCAGSRRVDQALADAEDGEDDLARAPALRAAAPAPARRRAAPRAAPWPDSSMPARPDSFLVLRTSSQKSIASRGRDRIAVHDAQRIVRLLHVQLGERAPACRRRRRTAGRAPWPSHGTLRDRLVDDVDCALSILPPVASISRRPPSGSVDGLLAGDRAAMSISSRLPPPRSPAMPVGSTKAHHDALRGELGFLLARQDLDRASRTPSRRAR